MADTNTDNFVGLFARLKANCPDSAQEIEALAEHVRFLEQRVSEMAGALMARRHLLIDRGCSIE